MTRGKQISLRDRALDVFPTGRTRFGDIVAEFWGPKKPSRRAVILLDGCPSFPSKQRFSAFLARKGFWVFYPRYRGTWESRGRFLARSPHEDVLLVADALRHPFRSVYEGTRIILDIEDITVIGASFGGAATIIASADSRIKKAIAIAPVVDWCRTDREGESIGEFARMLDEGFPGAYRLAPRAIAKLCSGKFYSPLSVKDRLSPKKLFIIHDPNDTIVPIGPTRELVRECRLPHVFLHGLGQTGAHLSASILMQRDVWRIVKSFLFDE
jgi:dipeptidyl aminopeptidase/acylaminoacyl peptidase